MHKASQTRSKFPKSSQLHTKSSNLRKATKSSITTTTKLRKLKPSPHAPSHNLIAQHGTIPIFNISKRNVSLFEMPTPEGLLVQNTQDDLTSLLQAGVEENISHGSIDFSRGKVVFDARSSINNFARYRVVEHRSTDLTAKEQRLLDSTLSDHAINISKPSSKTHDENDSVYYSFQQVYDEGDEEHDSPYVNIKSVIKAGSDNVNTLHLSSMNALVNALVFSSHPPQRTLYIGNWGGVLPQYISQKLGSDVEIIDPDAMSQYMSKSYSPGVFFDNYNHTGLMNTKFKVNYQEDLPEHPFDIIFTHKQNLLNHRKQQLKQMNSNNLQTPDVDVELQDEEIDQILKEQGEGLNASSVLIDNDENAKRISTSTGTSLNSVQPSQDQQGQEELDTAHTQLHLEESIVAFQKFRQRGQNTGRITMFPSIIDANTHLASLYSSYYLDKSRAIPTAISYLTQKRHTKHLEEQHQQTHLNVKAMVIDKFNLRGLLQSSPLSATHPTKLQYEALAEELNDLRFQLLLLSKSQFDSELNITPRDIIDEALDTTDPETEARNELSGKINMLKEKLTPTQVRVKKEGKIAQVKREIFSKRATLDSLQRILDEQGPSDAEISQMAEKVIKWTTRRLNAIQTFSAQEVELLGDYSQADVDYLKSVVVVDTPEVESEVEEGKTRIAGGIEFDAEGNVTIRPPKASVDTDNGKNGKPVKLAPRLNDIFDEGELEYAEEFNKQFISLLIHDHQSQDQLNMLNTSFPDVFDPADTKERASPTNALQMATKFHPRFIQQLQEQHSAMLSSENFSSLDLDGFDPDTMNGVIDPRDNSEENTAMMFRTFLDSQSMDGIWFQTSISTLQRYGNTLRNHQSTIQDLERTMNELKISNEHMKVLSTIHENVLDSIYLPMKGYDVIIHDHENDPITLETLKYIKEALIIEGEDDVVRHGVYIKRSSLVDPAIARVQYESIEDWLPNIQKESVRLKNLFKHVYWTQPSHDNIVFVATDSPLGSDLITNHPLDAETIIDHSVALWQTGAFGLDIIEQSDKWQYISQKGQDIVSLIDHRPEAFLHGTENESM